MTPYYERDGITIYLGDTLEVMAYLYEALRLVFDAILADLPYGTTACSWDTIIPFEPLWLNYKRLAKGNGAVVLFGKPPFSSKLILSNVDQFRYQFYWEKPKGANFAQSAYRPLQVIEEIMIFSPSPAVFSNVPTMAFNPQKIKRKKPYYRECKAEHQVVSKQHDGAFLRNPEKGIGKRYHDQAHPRSLLYFSVGNDETTKHPTQKPVALLQYLIRTYTNPGELILDNTMGSGTTLLAAQNEGRRAVGIELSEDYCKIAVDRLRQPSFFSIPDKPKIKEARTQPALFGEQ